MNFSYTITVGYEQIKNEHWLQTIDKERGSYGVHTQVRVVLQDFISFNETYQSYP